MQHTGPIRDPRGKSLSNSRGMCRSTPGAVNPFLFCTSKIASHLFTPQQLKGASFQGFTRFPGLTPFVSADAQSGGRGRYPCSKANLRQFPIRSCNSSVFKCLRKSPLNNPRDLNCLCKLEGEGSTPCSKAKSVALSGFALPGRISSFEFRVSSFDCFSPATLSASRGPRELNTAAPFQAEFRVSNFEFRHLTVSHQSLFATSHRRVAHETWHTLRSSIGTGRQLVSRGLDT